MNRTPTTVLQDIRTVIQTERLDMTVITEKLKPLIQEAHSLGYRVYYNQKGKMVELRRKVVEKVPDMNDPNCNPEVRG